MIKRTDNTGDWYVWDTERGIVSGNDPYLYLNERDAEVNGTDYIDPLNANFTVTSNAPTLNASGAPICSLRLHKNTKSIPRPSQLWRSFYVDK